MQAKRTLGAGEKSPGKETEELVVGSQTSMDRNIKSPEDMGGASTTSAAGSNVQAGSQDSEQSGQTML